VVPMPEVNSSPRKLTAPRGLFETVSKDVHVGGDFYVTPVLNELILNQARIGLHNIESSRYLPIKSERQLQHTEAHYEQGV
ncbi:hypothetical protein, partial [Burkholderia vietnamiensis]|uniref:hypothetical protein n=1 Tax=Burkholderia vietnamiensis TaxID=60552 RepID=UPI001E3781BF